MADNKENTTDNKEVSSLEQMAEKAEVSTSNETELFSEDFFRDLDKSVNAGILTDTEEKTKTEIKPSLVEKDGSSEKNISDGKTVEQLEKEIETINKRYDGSSKEAIKLKQMVDDVKPFLPLLDAMRKDSNLTSHIENYFEGGGQAKTVQERLGLAEDFVYDSEEAMMNPKSDSARLFKATMTEAVRGELVNSLKTQRDNDKKSRLLENRQKEETAFKEANPEEDWTGMEEFMKEHVLTLDDIKLIKDRDVRDSTIADSARKTQFDKMKKTQELPESLATSVSADVPEQSSGERLVGLLNTLDPVENIFTE